MSSVADIRSAFLNYFVQNGHEAVASSPLVPRNDPTLMFTNAGMVQFKNVFTGLETPACSRAVTSQKCVRAGGKHNDLDNVGYTARHHTFFEMLGNFSFGDYFKDVAIELAWNLMTGEFGLPKDRLLVTVFDEDEEAYGLWRTISGLPEERVIRIPTSDNFWAMGDSGPCGPCSEIFFDHGDHVPGGPPGSPDEDGDRFVEVWNLVFMQYEQTDSDNRVDLPRPSIDTGMGLERIAAVLQGKHDNYDIDLMRGLILASAEATNTDPDGRHKISHRVIADHLRAASFLIADGVLPSNEGRGYVVRRIMRRAMRHAELIGVQEPLMWRLVPALTAAMGQAFPELNRAQPMIVETFRLEETRFRKTLSRGLQILNDETADMVAGDALAGEVAFRLYDTYGFPLDLTEDALRARLIGVDNAGFEAAMERQRAEARNAWAGSGEAATETVWFGIREKVGATEFLGYDTEMAESIVVAILREGVEVARLDAGMSGLVVTNQTPFYAESGGQVGDTGWIRGADGAAFRVTDTQKKFGELWGHAVVVEDGALAVGDSVEMRVETSRRSRIRANHSATHLIHEGLRQVLGDHVVQKGSLVSPDRLRFDFSHPGPVTDEERTAIEDIANHIILQNTTVTTRLMDVDAAIEAGAMALFGEKYGDEVRVVSMGTVVESGKADCTFSAELCGGTHVRRTGDIGLVALVSESAVGAGTRRVEALTGDAARHHLEAQDRTLKAAAAVLRVPPPDLPMRIEGLLSERRSLEDQLADARRRLASGADAPARVREIGGTAFLARVVDGVPARELKGLADLAKDEVQSGVVALVGVASDGKAGLVVGVTNDLIDRISAVDLVRAAAPALGGKGGGGRVDLAQAGGPNGKGGAAAVEAVATALGALIAD